ncbi:MAG TPA: outer membrane beta-barrel protein [Thermoanaerobaculia bacterium]
MRFIRRIFRLLPAIVLMSGFARAAAGQQEKPVDPDSLTGGSRRFGLVINGFAAGNFNYNFNTDENNFESSVLAVSLFRALSDRVSFFGQVTVHKEESSPFAPAVEPARIRPLASRHAEEEGGSSFSTEIDNLQVSWAADPGRGLSIIFGKFDSPLAIERDDAPLNFQATPSFVFDFARPVKFTGLMARQTFSPKFEGYAILTNGWDVDSDNNHAKTGAFYGIWSPWPIAHFGLGVIHGAEKDGRTGDRRTTGVATILVQQTDSWVWGEEFVYGSEPHSAEDGGTATWFGDMFFTHHRLGKHWAITLRTDYFDDIEGSRTGQRQVLRSFTLSPQYLIGGGFFGLYRTLDRTSLRIPEVAVRLDLRFDRSTERVFASKTGQARRDDRSATLQVVYVF